MLVNSTDESMFKLKSSEEKHLEDEQQLLKSKSGHKLASNSKHRYNLRARNPIRSYESSFSTELHTKPTKDSRTESEGNSLAKLELCQKLKPKVKDRQFNSKKTIRPRLSSISEEKENSSESDTDSVHNISSRKKKTLEITKIRLAGSARSGIARSDIIDKANNDNREVHHFTISPSTRGSPKARKYDNQTKTGNVSYTNCKLETGKHTINSRKPNFNSQLHVEISDTVSCIIRSKYKDQNLGNNCTGKLTFSQQQVINGLLIEKDYVPCNANSTITTENESADHVDDTELMPIPNSPLYDMPPPSTKAQKDARRAKRKLQLERWRRHEESRTRSERFNRRQQENVQYRRNGMQRSTKVHWKSNLEQVFYIIENF